MDLRGALASRFRYSWMRVPVCSEDTRERDAAGALSPTTIVRVHSEEERQRVLALRPPGMRLHVLVVDARTPEATARPEPEVVT